MDQTMGKPARNRSCEACGESSAGAWGTQISAGLATAAEKLQMALAAVHEVLEVEQVATPGANNGRHEPVRVPDAFQPPVEDVRHSAPLRSLTPRQRQVLALVANGNSNRRVAKALGIAEKTVKNHLCAIFLKVGASDRTEAVVIGIRGGIVTLRQQGDAGPSGASPEEPPGPAWAGPPRTG